jgi:hypothetical protein
MYPPLVEMSISAAIMENGPGVPQKLKIELPYYPAVLLLAICPKGNEISTSKKYLHYHVY